MAKRRVRLAGALAAVAMCLTLGAPSASADSNGDVVACPMLTTFNFSTTLGTANTSGTINASYTGACASAGWFGVTNGFWTGVEQDAYGTSWSNSYSFSGNCLLANMSYYFNDFLVTPLIVGGSVVVADTFNPFYDPGLMYEVDVLVPLLAPCLETSATGYGQPGFIGQWD